MIVIKAIVMTDNIHHSKQFKCMRLILIMKKRYMLYVVS